MNIPIICYVPAQVPYLVKIFFLRYQPKCSQPIRLLDFQNKYLSRANWWNSLTFYMLYRLKKIKSWFKVFWLDIVKNGCDQFGFRTLIKLTVSEEWAGGILHVDTDSQKLKADQKVFGQAWSKMGVASLVTGLLNWLHFKKEHGMNWFFACWYKFRKAKSWFDDFWVGKVKNGHGLLVHETFKSTVY